MHGGHTTSLSRLIPSFPDKFGSARERKKNKLKNEEI